MSEQIAAVDLGSNSFHMIVAHLDGGRLTIVDRLRERVRLGSGLDADANLTDEAQERALACLHRFGQRVRDLEPGRVRAVGTNTLRKARNGPEFVTRAHEALGHPIDIIAGREEARLIYLGVAQTVPGDTGRRLVVDIGGGSTECIIGDGFEILDADSLYMGCVSFSNRYFPGGVINDDRFDDAEIGAQLELQTIVDSYVQRGWETAVGCSGTIHAITGILRANGWSDDGITKKGLKRLRKALVAAGDVKDLSLPGLQPDRRPVIAGGTAILKAIFESLRVETMLPSPGALREGALYDLVGRIQHEDVRDRTIQWFKERYSVDPNQADRVRQTALSLLHQVAPSWNLDERTAEQLLSWASDLREIGTAIAHTGFHKHGAYIVKHADMAGFSRDGQTILAALIQSQRRKPHPEIFEDIPADRLGFTRRLCVLFRIAVTLNRSRSASQLPRFVLKPKKKSLALALPDTWLSDHPLSRTDLENEARHIAALGYEFTLRPSQ